MRLAAYLKLLGITLFTLTCNYTYAQKGMIKSVWAGQPKKIDGSTGDWKLPFKNTDEDSKLQYSFSNDSANLYICLITDEQLTQNKISVAGVNIWIDRNGKKVQNTGVQFPIPGAPYHGPPPGGDEPHENFNPAKMQQQILSGFKTIKLQGLIGIQNSAVSLQNQYGVSAAIQWDTANMTIEYKIPLTAFSRPGDSARIFAFCIEVPAPDIQGMPGGMPPPGMDGGMGGEGGPPPPMGNFSEMAKADVIWIKLKLANP